MNKKSKVQFPPKRKKKNKKQKTKHKTQKQNKTKQKTKTKFLLLFLIFQIVLAMKLNHGLSAMTILKTFIKKKLLKIANLRTKRRGNSFRHKTKS